MKSKLTLIVVLVVLALPLAACSPAPSATPSLSIASSSTPPGSRVLLDITSASAPPNRLSLDFASSGKEVTLAAGDTLTVTIEGRLSRQGDGFARDTWYTDAKLGDGAVVQQLDYRFQPTATPGGTQAGIWTFKALKPGESTISMVVISASIPAPRAGFGFKVIVK